ncbi:hypothetical protein Cni_G23292 [Canna indica]|uniref:Reverse transcriptase zinc-binding domain-containing protein n=1 Tax=Canna indica TaxID=4628 RepID=A0AAQ3KVW9_9LILI|nr:hypothetical protein Cni_G23292 [Canna indica]
MWSLQVFERVKIFLWKMIWGRFPTFAWFNKISGIEVENCVLCSNQFDEQNHIFFNCDFAQDYWCLVESKLNIRFRYRNGWENGEWLKEADQYEELSGSRLKDFLANSFWFL